MKSSLTVAASYSWKKAKSSSGLLYLKDNTGVCAAVPEIEGQHKLSALSGEKVMTAIFWSAMEDT